MAEALDERGFGFGLDAEMVRSIVRTARDIPGSGPQRTLRGRLRQLWFKLWARTIARSVRAAERLGLRSRSTCPICCWEGVEFRPLVVPGWMQRNAICPGCGSVQRHRLLATVLRDLTPDGPTVWVAPERCLLPLMDAHARALTLDLEQADVDATADVEALPIAGRSLSLLFSSDVLEHVVDDARALREVARVLDERGVAVIHVPVLCTETVEYGFANEGEFGHRRAYGPDIVDRFSDAGLEVDAVLASALAPAERRRLGLLDWDVVFVARLAAAT